MRVDAPDAQNTPKEGFKAGSIRVAGLISKVIENQMWDRLKLKDEAQAADSLEIRVARVLQLPKAAAIPEFTLLEWAKQPFDYQVEGIRMLISNEALLLADDMGLGKTFQALAALRIMFFQKKIEHVLIVVPASLIIHWRREIRLLAPELLISTVHGTLDERVSKWRARAHIFLTSYETLRSDLTDNPLSPPRRHVWDVMVLDEAQKIKNRDAEISRKCKLLPRKRAWSLTGTPLENKPDDLASILEFTRVMKDGDKLFPIYPGLHMHRIQQNLQLRRKKCEVLKDLPPKTISTIPLRLNPGQRQTYDRAELEGVLQLKEKGPAVRIENVLELIMRLKQICNFCPRTRESSKMDDIEERIGILAEEGHKALIFSQFVDDNYGVAAIAQRLKHYRVKTYTGALDSQQKERVIDTFKADPECRALILSLRAGGQGLNLQEATYVFHFDRWWNPAVEAQAEDRVHRIGQTFPVHVYRYTCENTIEERIETVLAEKRQIFKELVDDVSIPIESKLTEKEIFGLFGLTPP